MYLSHYGLTFRPFSISPDPSFLWLGEKHTEALATLQYGIQENKGFLVLTGDVGTGKTVLVNRLIQLIEGEVLVAIIPDPNLELIDFYNTLTAEFKMGGSVRNKGEFLIHFKKFLSEAYGDQKNVLLIIDEAQRLEHELMDEIRVLSNINFHSKKLINIFLVGQSELRKTLLKEENRAFRQRISVNYHIEPLTEKETRDLIEYRLTIAGATQKIFTADAMCEVYAFSQGFPRLINVICDRALMSGYATGAAVIDGRIIKECAGELRIPYKKADGRLIQSAGGESRQPPAQPLETVGSSSKRQTAQRKAFLKVAVLLTSVMLLGGTALWFIFTQQFKKFDGSTGKENELVLAQSTPKPEQMGSGEMINSKADKIAHDEVAKDHLKGQKLLAGKVVIYFRKDSAELDRRYLEKLAEIAGMLSRYPDLDVIIESYTDSYGNYFNNLKLSQVRANVIKGYFVAQGIAESRVTAIGLGAENPVGDNATREGRNKNRRVEIRFKQGAPG